MRMEDTISAKKRATTEKADLIKEVLELQRVGDIILRRFAPEPWIELNLTIAQLKSLFFIAAHHV